jgi:hypothetical protein
MQPPEWVCLAGEFALLFAPLLAIRWDLTPRHLHFPVFFCELVGQTIGLHPRIDRLPVRVFDLSLYNGEAFYLLIRLRTLSSVMSRVLIGCALCTFSGLHNRPPAFAPYETEIAQFGDVLRLVYLNICGLTGSWKRQSAARHQLTSAVLSEKARPDDLVILSDADEYIDPAVLRRLVHNPPPVCYRLAYHRYYYSLRWQFYRNWVRVRIFRAQAISNPSLFGHQCSVYPGIAGVHCGYCFNSVKGIIDKLQTFAHTEYSHGRWVDPVHIVARVACGMSLFNSRRDDIYLTPPNPRFLDIPPDMNSLLWRMPFKDLPELRLDPGLVRTRAQCTPNLTVSDGIVQPYA